MCGSRIPVPARVWRPLAESIAAQHNLTILQMLYGGSKYCFCIPRGRFWRALRARNSVRGLPYSLPAIAAISGHSHKAVLWSLRSDLERDFYMWEPDGQGVR